jgi:hypothetical protein
MKTIIISDIQGQAKSIIPYGLRLARANEVAVDILHTIDPRKTQGTSSPYADSQSITPGTKLSHEKIIQREMHQARQALEKYISGEGSRLNYPLKINLVIESETLEKSIKTMINRYPGSIIMASLHPANSMVENLDELLSFSIKLHIPVFFIPPEYPFKELRSCMLYTNFNHKSYESLSKITRWLTPFEPMIHAFGMAAKRDRTSALKISSAWKREAISYAGSPMNLKTTLISDGDPYQQFVDYIRRNNTELILLSRNMFEKGSGFRLSTGLFEKAMKEISRPAAIY